MHDNNKSDISLTIREPIKSIAIKGKEEELTLIGQGATCLVYKNIEGTIFKEFFPLINGYIPAMRRTESGELILLEGVEKNPAVKAAYEKSLQGFGDSIRIANKIRETYKDTNADMRIFPERCEAAHGLWQEYRATAGDVFCDYLKNKRETYANKYKEYFSAVLNAICLLTHDVMTYHKAGYINLDIKPQNMYVLYNDAGSISAVRNLDFGSALDIDGLMISIDEEKRRVANTDLVVSSINNKYFSTTEHYYYEKSLRNAIKTCIESGDYEEKKNALIRLDAIAVVKVLIYALSGDLDHEVHISFGDENLHLKNKLFEIFAQNKVTTKNNLFEEYNCYFHLYDLITYVFTNKNQETMLEEIEKRLLDILCILGKRPGAEGLTPRQKHALAMHKIFAARQSELANRKLKTVADIYEYAKKGGLWLPPTCGELNYFLEVGVCRESSDSEE